MATSIKTKKRCVKCDDNANNSGLFICDGCGDMFCVRHVTQHREELNNQLEFVVQEYDLIKDQLSQLSSDHILFKEINNWEKQSIIKIQKIAELARNDLQQLIHNSNQRLINISEDIAENIRFARKTDNFSEIDLTNWKKKLDELKIDIESSVSCDLVKDKHSPIYLIKIQTNNSIDKNANVKSLYTIEDKFGEIYGPVQLDKADLRSKYVGNGKEYGRIRGHQKYSRDRSMIRFKIEKSKSPEQLFFGITTSNSNLDQRLWSGSSTIGWCGDNNIWQHGYYDELVDQSVNGKFQMGDILQLTLNCKQQQIELYNQRTNSTRILHVDINQTPFPWQFLIGLYSSGDCVTII
jgi:hypothetical protein